MDRLPASEADCADSGIPAGNLSGESVTLVHRPEGPVGEIKTHWVKYQKVMDQLVQDPDICVHGTDVIENGYCSDCENEIKADYQKQPESDLAKEVYLHEATLTPALKKWFEESEKRMEEAWGKDDAVELAPGISVTKEFADAASKELEAEENDAIEITAEQVKATMIASEAYQRILREAAEKYIADTEKIIKNLEDRDDAEELAAQAPEETAEIKENRRKFFIQFDKDFPEKKEEQYFLLWTIDAPEFVPEVSRDKISINCSQKRWNLETAQKIAQEERTKYPGTTFWIERAVSYSIY